MKNMREKGESIVKADTGDCTGEIIRPALRVVTEDEGLIDALRKQLLKWDVTLRLTEGEGPCLIDPAVGVNRIRSSIDEKSVPPMTAILRRPSFPAALFLALRLSKGRTVADPRMDPEPMRTFINEAFGQNDFSRDRRVFPRAGQSGVELILPENTDLLDVSPYGARIRALNNFMDTPVVRLRIRLNRPGIESDIDCQVAERTRTDDQTELRLRFFKISSEAQQELLRITNSELLCRTISDTFTHCERENIFGFRRVTRPFELLELLDTFVADGAVFTVSRMHFGRPVQAKPISIDVPLRQYRVALDQPGVLGPVGNYIRFSTSIRHESYLMDGYVLHYEDKEAVFTFPSCCLLTDHRAQEREKINMDAPLFVEMMGRKYTVEDLSVRGFSFNAGDRIGSDVIPENGRLEVRFDFGEGVIHRETALIRHRIEGENGIRIGAVFLDVKRAFDQDTVCPLIEETCLKEDVMIQRGNKFYISEVVSFLAGERDITGLWTEVGHTGPSTVVIVPPAWAKTKESTGLLAQFLCNTFDANKRSIAVLRFDYSNALGESYKDPQFRQPGHETLGFTASACVEDIRAAVKYAVERLSPNPFSIVLVGMSYSGPICLRAAAEDKHIAKLIEFMGASDIQDLIRTSTGGIDYVSIYRAGIRSSVQNVLGLLSDTDYWNDDGIRSRLLLLQDAQVDAARLSIPILWIHGVYDAFVNENRIRSILDVAKVEKYLIKVPYGHLPTKSADALLAFIPAIRFMLRDTGIKNPIFSVPSDEQIMEVFKQEWSRAPRVRLPSLQNFWREYMLGITDGSLGFDVLSMTSGYQELMELQVKLLDVKQNEALHDLGGGMGHMLPYLARTSNGNSVKAFLYDLVPQLFDGAKRRAGKLGINLTTVEWDAEKPESLSQLSSSRVVLMSMFLSCLSNPSEFLRQLTKVLPSGARIVASSIRPDADISKEYVDLLENIRTGQVRAPDGYTQDRFRQAVRDYMNSAAWLLRLTDEGTFHLFDKEEFVQLFKNSGLKVLAAEMSFGTPHRAVVLKAEKL
ncbi:MAG: methyltransferase domain-containing protein [Desulfobacterales bacterium]